MKNHKRRYVTVTDIHKERFDKLIRYMVDTVLGECGDGDAFWYSEWYNINDIYNFIVQELEPKLKEESKYFNWELELKGDTINWGIDQEGLTITNDEFLYITIPSWSQFTLKY